MMELKNATIGTPVVYQHREGAPKYRGVIIDAGSASGLVAESNVVLVGWRRESRGKRMPTWVPLRFLTECCPDCGATDPGDGLASCDTCADVQQDRMEEGERRAGWDPNP